MTIAESIMLLMRETGFAPSQTLSPSFVEFTKDYKDEQGRYARAIVHFDRGDGTPRLARFHAVVQAIIDTNEEAIRTRAPPVMRTDLLSVLARAEPAALERRSVVTRRCDSCNESVSEFYIEEERTLCRSCR